MKLSNALQLCQSFQSIYLFKSSLPLFRAIGAIIRDTQLQNFASRSWWISVEIAE